MKQTGKLKCVNCYAEVCMKNRIDMHGASLTLSETVSMSLSRLMDTVATVPYRGKGKGQVFSVSFKQVR